MVMQLRPRNPNIRYNEDVPFESTRGRRRKRMFPAESSSAHSLAEIRNMHDNQPTHPRKRMRLGSSQTAELPNERREERYLIDRNSVEIAEAAGGADDKMPDDDKPVPLVPFLAHFGWSVGVMAASFCMRLDGGVERFATKEGGEHPNRYSLPAITGGAEEGGWRDTRVPPPLRLDAIPRFRPNPRIEEPNVPGIHHGFEPPAVIPAFGGSRYSDPNKYERITKWLQEMATAQDTPPPTENVT